MDANKGLQADSGKTTVEIKLSNEQIAELQKLTGVHIDTLVVEAEPFVNPPLGTPVLGKIFTDPRSKVTARVNARFK